LRAVVRLTLLLVLVLLLLSHDAVLRLDFVLGIGIPFGCAATIVATTEAPPRRRSRRGRIPKRNQRSELDTVPLCLREEASPFWIILLLVSGDPAAALSVRGVTDGRRRRILSDHQRRELLCRGRWLNRFDGPAPAPGSDESAPPSRILPAIHIAECGRDNLFTTRFARLRRSAASERPTSSCDLVNLPPLRRT
jgi:hypothetical protein